MAYVDGYLLVVPKVKLAAYKKMATMAGKIWREHGAIGYYECVGDDLDASKLKLTPFPKVVKAKPDELVFFSFAIYKSRKDRDRVNKKVMSDPRLMAMCDPRNTPFDMKRMVFGGFKVLVQA